MTEERRNKIFQVVSNRQSDITVVLNNVHDPHNIGAVLRSCDAVGISEIYVLYNEPGLGKENVKLGKKSAASARKWVDVYLYRDTEKCFSDIRKSYSRILGTHLGVNSLSLYELDLTDPIALVFGNEHDGISSEVLGHLDGNFLIPQFGMVASLNISVSVAVSLYEACRQRLIAGKYNSGIVSNSLLESYISRHKNRNQGRRMIDSD